MDRYYIAEQKSVCWVGKLLKDEDDTITLSLSNMAGCFICLTKKEWKLTKLRTVEEIEALERALKKNGM